MNTIQFLLLQFPHPMSIPLSVPPPSAYPSRPRAKVIWFYSLFCSILTWLPRPLPATTTGNLSSAAETPKTQLNSVSFSAIFQSSHSNSNNNKNTWKILYTIFHTLFPHHDKFNWTFSTYSISFLICIVTYLSLSAIKLYLRSYAHTLNTKYLNI